jgi:hypothetical protein
MKTFKALLAVLLCILTLSACGGAVSASTSADDDISPAKTASEDKEEKTDSDDKVDDKTEDSETEAETGEPESQSSSNGVPFPETVFRYAKDKNDLFIDQVSGEVLLSFNKSDDKYGDTKINSFVRFEDGYARYGIKDGYVFIDMNGNIVPRPANALPDDIDPDYPKVSADGVYIAKDGNFYGLKNINGSNVTDFIYSDIKPKDDYTLFAFELNKKGGVMNTTGETIINFNAKANQILLFKNVIQIGNGGDVYNYKGEMLFDIGGFRQIGNNILVSGAELNSNQKDQLRKGVIDTNGNVIKNFSSDTESIDYDAEIRYFDSSIVYSCLPIYDRINRNHVMVDKNGTILPIEPIIDLKLNFKEFTRTNNYSAIIDKNNNKSYLIDNNNAIATIEGYQVQLLNDYILYSTENIMLTFYDFNMNEITTASNKYNTYGDSVVYEDANNGLYGVIIKDKIVIEAKFTDVKVDDKHNIITAKRGNDTFYYTVATGAEIVLPE